MRKNILKLKLIIPILALSIGATSCKYQTVGDADYAEQRIYMPAAAQSAAEDAGDGVFNINRLDEVNGAFRYNINTGAKKFYIPLSVYRSGANLDGAVNVQVAIDNSTIPGLTPSKLPVGTVVLPQGQYSIEPSVTIGSGQTLAKFTLAVELDLLRANPTQKYAIGVAVSSPNVAVTSKLDKTIIMIDPSILTLVPTADFSYNNTILKDVKFNNISSNGARYKWDFGDGTTSTQIGPNKTYANYGTYNVTLTTYGALGEENKVSVTKSVVVPPPAP